VIYTGMLESKPRIFVEKSTLDTSRRIRGLNQTRWNALWFSRCDQP